jgi:peptide/nickel transport system ATP-binding protein
VPAAVGSAGLTADEPLLQIEGIHVRFTSGRHRFGALTDVSADIRNGETVAIVGESGAGKSTLARAVLGLVPIDRGVIRFEGTDISHLRRQGRVRLANNLQVVFQNPYSSLNPARSVRASLAEPLVAQRWPRERIDQRLQEMLERVGLSASVADRYPRQFSGGQRQRIAIARALMVSPKLVICDEALSALDLSVQAQIINLLLELRRDLGLAYMFIGHDLTVVRHIADRVVVLRRGRVVEEGLAEKVCTRPSDPYTTALMEASPVPDPRRERERLRVRTQRVDELR